MKFRRSVLSLLTLVPIVPLTSATWSTLYSSNSSTAYVYTDDGFLYTFPTNTSTFSVAQAQSMFVQISSPPTNSTLVIDENSDTLMAVYGTSGCGTSPINIATYDSDKNKWTKITSSSDNWYLDMPTVWAQPQTSVIYIFGGYCQSTNDISHSLYAYNTTSGEFLTPPNQNSPTDLYAAGVTAIDSSTFLLVGGKAPNGWISMNQVAVWEYNSWTFRTTGNSDNIDSRTNPLVIPIWADNMQNSASSVLVLGGSVNGRAAQPYAVNLTLGNGWEWSNSSLESVLDPSDIDGAMAIGTALLTLSKPSQSAKLQVNIYELDTGKLLNSAQGFPTVTPTPLPTQTVTVSTEQTASTVPTALPASKSLSKGGVAAVSTVVPIAALCALGAAAGLFYVRRRKRNNDKIRTMHLSPAPSMGDFINAPLAHNNDSWYSIGGDTASINSWNEKRAMYEENVNRHSTLSQTTAKEPNTFQSPPQSPVTTNVVTAYQNDEDNIFEGRDVQILVSSLRRTPLRVVNPDEESQKSPAVSRSGSTFEPAKKSAKIESTFVFNDSLVSRASSLNEGGRQNRSQVHVHKRNLSNISSSSETSSHYTQRSTSGTLNRRIPSNHTT
ncbi:hypothetical protein AWJ20_3389 [Sugiyamaella lignohabitans]|uniref:Kel1p n=1 Tax=Sugiyamaella lignohabitans TaxID=796027 RepID=A0A167FVD3_9ASCO|nr:uncharacterized protein AWJ20_3389 [Sugiyamaella lignohabitans]ANB15745.1 hypothetical protein AWJ20_3389 [Sugiyamaella lignohabitans]